MNAEQAEALKRLGGGRWQTRDGRFTIEPQGGSWVVVDGDQTDDLGMPLVRGPFGSLGAAREAIEVARSDEAPVSPLAAKLEEGRPADTPPRDRTTRRATKRSFSRPVARAASAAPGKPSAAEPTPVPTPAAVSAPPGKPRRAEDARAASQPEAPAQEPAPPAEPEWLRSLPAGFRPSARKLIERLRGAEVEDAADVAREELVDGEPAVVRVALRRRLEALGKGKRERELVAEVVALLAGGEDDDLDVRWRLVDADDRPIGDLRSGEG